MLLFSGFLFELTGAHKEELEVFLKLTESYYQEDRWIESSHSDFRTMPADAFDHPEPSSTSMAELATRKARAILGKDVKPAGFKPPVSYDFLNLSALFMAGAMN